MLLGYNTNGLQNHRLADALHLLADAGYGAVALTPDICHLDPLHCTPRQVDAVAALLQRLHLRVVIETGARYVLDPAHKHEPTLMTRDAAQRGRRLELYRRCAQIGRDLGAEVLSFFSGVDRQPGPDSAAWLAEGVARTCDLVAELGLTPALEPEPGHAVAMVADYERVCEAARRSGPSLCLDVGHLYVTEEPAPEAVIAAWHPRLAQVHLEDVRRGVHEHLLPGEGDVDFRAVRAALERHGYTGAVCFELSRQSHMAPRALELCRQAWERAAR